MTTTKPEDLAFNGVFSGRDPKTRKWPERKEIDDFVKDPQQVFLYIAALNTIQRRGAEHPLSYFQIGGIHGAPYREWPPKDNAYREMYCAHNISTFPTWHRVYVLLYEKTLSDIMKAWVSDPSEDSANLPEGDPERNPIPKDDRASFKNAAQTWRHPYWDFLAHRPFNNEKLCIPFCASTEKLKDSGALYESLQALATDHSFVSDWLVKNDNNPLYRFKFPANAAKYGYTPPRRYTARHPRTNGDSDITALKTEYARDNITVSARTNILLCYENTSVGNPRLRDAFNIFNNGGDDKLNLQGVHGTGHVRTGGVNGGDMFNPVTAGFDPIFFLHHTNIDRMIALWQAGNPGDDPNVWVTRDSHGNDQYTNLEPFYRVDDDGDIKYWTSVHTRYIDKLGYRYQTVEQVHNYSTMMHQLREAYAKGVVDYPHEIVATATFEVAEIGPFILDLYYQKGESKDDSDPRLTQLVHFAAPRSAPCANCDENRIAGSIGTLSTTLSPGLAQPTVYGPERYKSLGLDGINADLAKKLYWRLFTLDKPGEPSHEIPVEDFKSLIVSLQGYLNLFIRSGHGREAAELDTPAMTLFAATAGKSRGLEEGQALPWKQG